MMKRFSFFFKRKERKDAKAQSLENLKILSKWFSFIFNTKEHKDTKTQRLENLLQVNLRSSEKTEMFFSSTWVSCLNRSPNLCAFASLRSLRLKKRLNRFCLTIILLTLASCNMTPKYHRPNMDMPDDYRLHLTDDKQEDYPFICDPEMMCKDANVEWWEELHDPILDNLITNALANNNDLKIAVARVDEFYGIMGVVASQLYPQVDGNVYKQRQQYSLKTEPPLSPAYRRINTYAALLSASYELDIWGKIQSRSDAAYTDYLRQIEVRRTVVLTLVAETASAYIQLRKFDKQLEISKDTLKSRIEAERIARVRFEEGLTSELPLKQAQSETEAAIIAIKVLEIAIPRQENFISVLIGQPPGPILRGKALDDLTMPAHVPVGLPSQLLQQRPDVLAAEDALIATNFDIGAAKAAFYPDISLTGYYGNLSANAGDLFTGKAVTWGTMVNLLQPIFTGGRLISQLEIAKARNNEALYNYLSVVLNALREVNDALISHKKNLELVVEQTKQVAIFRQYRHLAELQYNNGESDYLNVLDAERRLFEAQILLADREADSFTSLINLYKALGGGWVIDADNFNQSFGFSSTLDSANCGSDCQIFFEENSQSYLQEKEISADGPQDAEYQRVKTKTLVTNQMVSRE